MVKKQNRRRGSSKAGRPRKAGERYPSGKLRPPEPNARVLADRAAMLGTKVDAKGQEVQRTDWQNASTPMDLALARGWVTEEEHRAGAKFLACYLGARLGGPSMGHGGPKEVDLGAEVGARIFKDMTSEEITEIWDNVFNRTADIDAESRTAASHRRWVLLNAALKRDEQDELFSVCVLNSWPQWLVQRVAGHFGTRWEAKRDVLVAGLRKVRLAMAPRKAPAPPPAPPVPMVSNTRVLHDAPKLVERTQYVNEAGEVLLEVELKRRRGDRLA